MAHALLALLLLLTQQAAWRHGLSHGAVSTGLSTAAEAHAPSGSAFEHAESACLQCLAYSAMANTLQQAQAPELPCLLSHVCTPAAAHTPHEASTALAYRSRAPPVV